MKKWLKLILVLIVFAIISVVLFLICRACNLTNIDKMRTIIEKSGKWGIIVFILIMLIATTIFCFVPVLDTAIVLLGGVLFGAKVGFLVCWFAVFVSSSILFFIGDKFGERLATKLIGKQELEKAQDLIDTKSKLILPFVFLIPCLPDDALCVVAGMTKMKYWYFALITIIFRGIDTFLVCFLGGAINWSALTVIEWVMIVNLIIVDIYLVIKAQRWLENKKKK